jgi:hypothetical protein
VLAGKKLEEFRAWLNLPLENPSDALHRRPGFKISGSDGEAGIDQSVERRSMEWPAEGPRFDSRQGEEVLFFAISSRPAVESTQPLLINEYDETDRSAPSSAELNKEWGYSLPVYPHASS